MMRETAMKNNNKGEENGEDGSYLVEDDEERK